MVGGACCLLSRNGVRLWQSPEREIGLSFVTGIPSEQPTFAQESRRLGTLVFLHLDSAFLWERDKSLGLNEIGHSFLCNESPVHLETW